MVKIYKRSYTEPWFVEIGISINVPQTKIIDFLEKRGYEIKPYIYREPPQKGFLIDEPPFEWHTFTATKEGEAQSKDNLFLNVFEKEVKLLLKEFMKV
ncbi:hypothetical protein [Riemerella anatipestifer]|uniref:hypothetical protein n=1 Tax=Riemerella anatipestifer TaxID=34085 RepID=UPI0021F85F32|nr:hypothetical protein [Riemerella anatipestifer]MCW0509495.1 hypothetical protein [Riemerella anatipestifer]